MKPADRKAHRRSIDDKPSVRLQRLLACWTDCYAALRLDGFTATDAARIVTDVFRERLEIKGEAG